VRFRNIEKGEVLVQGFKIDFTGNPGIKKERFDFRRKKQNTIHQRIVQRLDAKVVPSEKEPTIGLPQFSSPLFPPPVSGPRSPVFSCPVLRPRSSVVYGKSKHSPKPLHQAITPRLVSVDQHLCVASRHKSMPLSFQFTPQFPVVVYFAVEDHPDGSVFVGHGLMSATEIDDTEAAHTQSHTGSLIVPFIVGAAVGQKTGHPMERRTGAVF
jgi:hypothetical protein